MFQKLNMSFLFHWININSVICTTEIIRLIKNLHSTLGPKFVSLVPVGPRETLLEQNSLAAELTLPSVGSCF
jgi:hypothetical protein